MAEFRNVISSSSTQIDGRVEGSHSDLTIQYGRPNARRLHASEPEGARRKHVDRHLNRSLLLGLLWAAHSLGAQTIETPELREIDTPVATLSINTTTCGLAGVLWKSPRLQVIAEPKLSENFRILLPQPGHEANYFDSRNQIVTHIDPSATGVTCLYRTLKNEREEVPLEVRYTMEAVGPQLHFSIEVRNGTDRKLAEVQYGILGGQAGIGSRSDTEAMVASGTENMLPKPFTMFPGDQKSRFGLRYEATAFTYPGEMPMGWIDIYNAREGVGYYYANQNTETRLSALLFEMRPFVRRYAWQDDWPSKKDVPEGEPIGLTTAWVNFPYTAKDTFKAGPVALQVHNGDWHSASSIYRTWFDQHFALPKEPSWLRREMAWQSVIISNPEDVVVHRFAELPKLAADAKKYDITTFEILGWDVGGIDRGYPEYRPDPKLGTVEEFRTALADVRAAGVHPLIFANVQAADTATPIFRDKLQHYAVQGKWAPDWNLMGWGEGTLSARMGLTRSNMAVVSPAHPEFRKYLMDQYLQLVRDGADGFQMDKTNNSLLLDFNPAVPTSPDKSLLVGTLDTFRELLTQGRAINPKLALASEIWVDRAFPFIDVSYMRLRAADMKSTALRYTFPEWTSTIFSESPGDYVGMNNGMRYGLVWDMAPRHYNESVDDPLSQPLSRYVKELIRIRTQYANLLFLGRFNDTLGANIKGGEGLRYSVFLPRDPKSKDLAVVVVNLKDSAETATVDVPGRGGSRVRISAPDQPERDGTLPLTLQIPANRCVVIVSADRAAQ